MDWGRQLCQHELSLSLVDAITVFKCKQAIGSNELCASVEALKAVKTICHHQEVCDESKLKVQKSIKLLYLHPPSRK
jgi:hypothetical protein